MIDLSRVKSVLVDVEALVSELHGLDFNDPQSWTNKTKGEIRELRAQRSQELQLLATRLELAASLVRVEFWHAKGEVDPLGRRRRD